MKKLFVFAFIGAVLLPTLAFGTGLASVASLRSDHDLRLPTQSAALTEPGTTAIQDDSSRENSNAQSVFPRHKAYGSGVGALPGRVVWDYDPEAVRWNGEGYWWEVDHFNELVIRQMVDESIASLGGTQTAATGWNALFRAHNEKRNKSDGYHRGEKIAIKVNMNGMGTYGDNSPSQMSYANPVLVRELLTSLVEEAGVAPADITAYDASRVIPDDMRELCGSGILQGVQFRYFDLGGANDAQPDLAVPVVWSQNVSGETNYLPQCVTEADYLINLANLKGHSYGITLCGKNHFGTIMNSSRLRPPEAAGIHRYLTRNQMSAYTVLVDLLANEELGGKTVLYMLDGLICAPSEGASITGENARWQQQPFNNNYTSSILLSQDPVALDSVGADFLMNEPTVTGRNGALRDNPNVENYLHEAALVAEPPSGATYLNGKGGRVTNLGVHEHWNNPIDKQYGRNLGAKEGIELVQVGSGRAPSATGPSNAGPSAAGDPDAGVPDAGAENAASRFRDVPANAWYAEAVKYCRDHGLMSGTSATTFAPNGLTSRSMLVKILHNQAGGPGPGRNAEFSDVPANAWYRIPLFWAVENSVVSGYGDGRFGPNDPVSREQMATILWRSAGSPADSTTGAPSLEQSDSKTYFADQSTISSFAKAAVSWAREEEIINGKEGNRFDPRGPVTRAETAAMLYRYLN